ncbi:MAG: tRNA (guanosine(46)-N7)-methyltransferase TrmB [Acidobacteriota bacterium]
MPRVRVHQHVNPLSPFYRQPPAMLDRRTVFADPELPLHLDIGSARGRFLMRMATVQPGWNYLGVEIRQPLVDEANRLAGEAGLGNLHYAFCNAMLWLDRLLENIPNGMLQMVTIQFPDPWFKKKHAKRRMVNDELVDTVAKHLTPGGKVFVQTDIEPLFDKIVGLFTASQRFSIHQISENPFPIRTERETAVEANDLAVHRSAFTRLAYTALL